MRISALTIEQVTAVIRTSLDYVVKPMQQQQQQQQLIMKAPMKGVTNLKVELHPFSGERED